MDKEKSEERFCAQCNSPITDRVVDDIETKVCMNCSRVEWGYTKDEKEIVVDLQDYLDREDWWKISSLLHIFKRHLVSAHGKEAEVGDEEGERLVEHLKYAGGTYSIQGCSDCEKIIALIRQRRTVSREAVNQIWKDIQERGQYGLVVCLQELGITIEEPKP